MTMAYLALAAVVLALGCVIVCLLVLREARQIVKSADELTALAKLTEATSRALVEAVSARERQP